MNQIKKILAPTDLSELSKAGIRYSLNLARSLGAEVTIYHAVNYDEIVRYGRELAHNTGAPPPGELVESYKLTLKQFLDNHFADLLPLVETHQVVEMGAAAKNIVDRAEAEGDDLIVISTHGRTGLSHMLMGSVTEKVVRMARCPVLSIHPQTEEKTAKQKAA
jgi:nucleotide-binding universal stress UspA family protein